MGCLSLVGSVIKIFLVCAIITFLPGIPPHAEYKAYTVVKPKSLDAELLERRHLDKAEHIFDGQLTGPEAFAVYNGAVYTGIDGGFVVQIDEGELRPVVRFGKNCEDITEEHICGRPLGMKFDSAGNLYVADAYYGVFKYDIRSGQKTLLVDVNEEIDGKKSMFINDVAVAKDGTVYFTVTSTTFSLYEGGHAMLAPGDGRLMKYDPATKKASVLAEGLLTPNGITLSKNDEFLVFSESVGARVMRYDLKGSKKGSVSIFSEGLPGLPDNIRYDGQDGFFVSLVVPADEYNPAPSVSLGPFPYIRKFLSRLLFLIELPFAQINQAYPNGFCRHVAHAIGHHSTISFLSPDGATILHLDSKGQIRDALIGRDGSINHVSDMIVVGDYILLGSPYNNFIARVPRPNAPHHVHIKSVRFEEATSEEKLKEEIAAKQAAEEARDKKAREEQARAKKASEEAARKAAEESARQKKEAEAAAQRAAEEARARLAAEETKKRAAEELKAKKLAEEAKARQVAEENARKLAEEAKAKKRAEEAASKKLAEEAKAKKVAEEAKARKLAAEAKANTVSDDKKKTKTTDGAKSKEGSGNTVKN